MKIGEIMAQDREITLNDGKKTVVLTVANMVGCFTFMITGEM